MADVGNTCANCGHTQATGDFCEECGTRMPMAPAGGVVAQTVAPVAAGAGTASAAGAAAPVAAGAGAVAAGAAAQTATVTAPPVASPPPPPPPPAYVAQTHYGTPPPSARGRSFWNRLFDFSFEEFITPSIIKALFIIAMVVIGLSVLGMIIAGFTGYGAMGIFWLIGALIWGFIALLFARVGLELIIIFFRIKDDTEDMASKKR